ncbi:terpenoid synthase [Ophiobolus disseminans]|uniref:Terpene synthase n=1 Tax=Ophiobolus disseminans TaxID=1469910 RepID=A0A6A7A185_9PLEO|nr:terpenoid synthase [Ophiobolus disseminans]
MGSISISTLNGSSPDYRATLAARLRGQTILVPDILRTIYNNPKVRLNDTEFLTRRLDPWLDAYVPTEGQRAKQRKVNTPLVSSYFWARVPNDKFAVLGSFMAWFFLWDDEIDCGSLTLDNDGRTDAYCNDAIAFITSYMQPELNIARPAPGRLHNSGCFVDIGLAMQDGQSKADRDRYVSALVAYMNSVRAGQAQWQVGVSAVEDFIERRAKSIGVIPTLCTHVWGYGIRLPEWVWNHEAMQKMTYEVCVTVALYNDIASLKKELKANEVDNIIPILVFHHDISAQEAVDMTIEILDKSYREFLSAVECLKDAVSGEDEDVKRDFQIWVDACVDMLVGNVAWSLTIPRYLPRSALDDAGSGFKVIL